MSDSFATPCTIPHQAPLPIVFSRQEYWSGFPFLSPGDLFDPGIKPVSPALAGGSLPLSHMGSPPTMYIYFIFSFFFCSKVVYTAWYLKKKTQYLQLCSNSYFKVIYNIALFLDQTWQYIYSFSGLFKGSAFDFIIHILFHHHLFSNICFYLYSFLLYHLLRFINVCVCVCLCVCVCFNSHSPGDLPDPGTELRSPALEVSLRHQGICVF